MQLILLEVGLLLVLIIANGLFSMSELAILSSRKARLKRAAESGDRGAEVALELADDPNRFLSTVQVGITFVGTLAGVFGGATLAEPLARALEGFIPGLAPYSDGIGLTVVVVGISYLTLIFGELVPKRLAMNWPERIAARVAGPLRLISIVGVPVVRLLASSTELVLRVMGVKVSEAEPLNPEEIQALMQEGAEAGVFETVEHDMVRRVLRLGDHPARLLMTHWPDVVWIDVDETPEAVRRKVVQSPHSRFPVCEGSLDKVLGVVQAKDLLARGTDGQAIDVRGLVKLPLFVFGGMSALKVLERFKTAPIAMAIVLNEYGSVDGVLTLNDVLEAIVGTLPSNGGDEAVAQVVQRPDGSWLLDAAIPIDELKDVVPLPAFPEGDYDTLAGFILFELGRIPKVADHFEWGRYRFEVVDMAGNRIDRVRISKQADDSDSL